MNIIQYKHITTLFLIVIAFMLAGQPVHAQKHRDKDGKDNSGTFLEANTQKLLGNYDKAKDLFLECIEQDPDDAASMYELARIARINNKSNDALDWAQQAVDKDPVNVWYLKLLAELYQENMQFEESIDVMENLVELHPENLEYLYDLALSHLLVGNYQKSIRVYNDIEDKIGITEEISVQKQKIWQRMDKPDRAVEEIEALCEAWPEETRYKSILAELYNTNGMEDKALEIYLQIAEKEPENAYIFISLADYYRKQGDTIQSLEYLKKGFSNPQLDIDTKVQVLVAYFSAEDYYDARKETAIALANILIDTHPESPKAYSILSDLYYQDEQWAESRELLRRVIQLDSSKYMVWEQLLFTESYLEDFKAMRRESRRAIELFPQQPLPYLFSAVAAYQFEDHQQMITDLETGIRFVVRNDLLLAEFYNYLGDAYHQVGKDEKAYEAYESSLMINPENSIVLNNYAYYLSLNGEQLEKAKEMAEKATLLDPDNSSNMDTYGWVLYKLGNYEAALAWIGKAIEKEKQANAEVLEHYGDVLFKLGQKEKAIDYWKKAQKAGQGGSDYLDKKVQDGILYE